MFHYLKKKKKNKIKNKTAAPPLNHTGTLFLAWASLEGCNQKALNERGVGTKGGSFVIGIFNALRLREPDASISIIGMAMSVGW